MIISEIRVNNLFEFYKPLSKLPFIMKVEGLYFSDEDSEYRVINDQYSDLTLSGFKPINITEQWLKDLGFTQSQTKDKYFTIDNDMAISTIDDKIKLIMGNFVCSGIISELKYVHELQNLYFAIKHKELIYNPQ